MRYALFKYINLTHFKSIIIRIKNMLFIIFMQNLYEKFYDKKKRVIFASNKIFDSSTK